MVTCSYTTLAHRPRQALRVHQLQAELWVVQLSRGDRKFAPGGHCGAFFYVLLGIHEVVEVGLARAPQVIEVVSGKLTQQCPLHDSGVIKFT